MKRWMGEVRGEEKRQQREQLVQIESGDWCVSLRLQLSICFKVCFVDSILSKLLMSCGAGQISAISCHENTRFQKQHFNLSVKKEDHLATKRKDSQIHIQIITEFAVKPGLLSAEPAAK